MRKPLNKPCRICGQPVLPVVRKDRKAYWYPRQCFQCFHKSRNPELRKQRIGKAMAGLNHPRARPIGSRRLTSRRGYWYWEIKVFTSGHCWRYEHRVILEQKLGRKLKPNEIAHHLNGDTLDNRPENIELFNWGEHTSLHHSKN